MEVYPVILRLLFLVIPLLLTAGCATMESDVERDTRAYIDRGDVYSAKGQYDQAIADYNEALKINPRSSLAYENRGNVYTVKGQYDQAISDYDKAMEINPTGPAYANRAAVYFLNKEYDKAWDDIYNAQGLG